VTTIRQVSGDERLESAFSLYPYAFGGSPTPQAVDDLRRLLPYHIDNHTLVAEDGERTIATAAAFPAWQNLRGSVVKMAGIAWVATHPAARRQGHSRRLMDRLHSDMLDKGHSLATLFPFHSSFYDKLGYISLPHNRTATFPPEGLTPLLDVDIPGDVQWQGIKEGFDTYRAFQRTLLTQWHGFTYTPDYRAARALDPANRWLAVATAGDTVLGTMTYRIDDYGGTLTVDELLYANALGRALLLRFLAQHTHQVSRITATIAPDEYPETWVSGLTARTETETAFPLSPPLMARLLSVDALSGVRCGGGRVAIEVVDDHLISGRYLLDGSSGSIKVGTSGDAEQATLTAAALSGLAYGVLDPMDVVARGLGHITDDAAAELRFLLPACTPRSFGKG
jgi:predicted acetyltransferase